MGIPRTTINGIIKKNEIHGSVENRSERKQSSRYVTKYDFDEKEQKRDTEWHDKGI